MPLLDRAMYCSAVTLILAWMGDSQERIDIIETIKECCRNILTTTGVQRLTRPCVDMWIVLTMCKIHAAPDALPVGAVDPVPIQSAAPNPLKQVLSELNKVPYRGRILQGCSVSLKFAREMQQVCIEERNNEMEDWLWDFQFMMDAALHVFHW